MKTFEQLLQPINYADEALRPLLERLHHSLSANSSNLPSLKTSLIAVLEFLASPQGRTDANCRAVDFFLMQDEVWNADLLPDSYVEILADMSGALHDTISAPEIARNFYSTPEQLLERVKKLNS